jgi:carboxylate-amine ligase
VADGIRTVGVEEEMLLVDPPSGRALAVGSRLLAAATADLTGGGLPMDAADGSGAVVGAIEAEFQQQMIEVHTRPVERLDDLETEVRHWRSVADAAARRVGARVAAVGTSPMPITPIVAKSPRYAWIEERYGPVAGAQLTCGLHVHVGVADEEEGVGVLDRIRVWLPTLLALSVNSPFSDGSDTSYASFRTQAFTRWPSAGPAGVFGSGPAYRERVRRLVATGVILDEGMVYDDARLAVRYPTVEVRVADVCLRVADTVLVTALTRALVSRAAADWRDGRPAPDVAGELLRLSMWQASRFGLDGELLDATTLEPLPAWRVVEGLLEHALPWLERAGDVDVVASGLARLRRDGTGARLQRDVLERTGRLVDVVSRATQWTTSDED